MSELKEHFFCDNDEVFPRGYLGPLLSTEMRPYYLKSEADNAIAKKDKEIQRLENLCESYRIDCDNLAIREANAYKVIERDNKELQHNKYKRCMNLAKICENKLGTVIKPGYWDKCRKRWPKLAEQFKEAK